MSPISNSAGTSSALRMASTQIPDFFFPHFLGFIYIRTYSITLLLCFLFRFLFIFLELVFVMGERHGNGNGNDYAFGPYIVVHVRKSPPIFFL
jgi:hypothetical protein